MIRDVTEMFNRNLINILLISVVIVIPFSFFILSAINYFYVIDTIELNNLMAVFLIAMNFTALFPPFFYLAKHDLQDLPFNLFDLIKVFLGILVLLLFLPFFFL